jgi:hypothetical protein
MPNSITAPRLAKSRRLAAFIAVGSVATGFLLLGAGPANAKGPGDVRTVHCPAGKIVQLEWQNTGHVNLFADRAGQFDLNDWIGEYGPGSNSYNTGLSDVTFGFGNRGDGDIVPGTSTFRCVNFQI